MVVLNKAYRDDYLIDQSQSEQNFLALDALFAELTGERKHYVLDLGPAQGSTVEFFSRFQCRLYIEDLYRSLTTDLLCAPGEAPAEEGERAITDCLLDYGDTRFDLILFWDLFDYLSRDQLTAVLDYLRPHCRRGTTLFLITSAMRQMPAQPAHFKIVDQGHIAYDNPATASRESPGYKQGDLQRLLPDFRLHRGFRMSSGMEEYLFVHEGR